ncbi:MAG: hypothetical protein ACAH83_07455 [Alphaproteobacteria bacterium]
MAYKLVYIFVVFLVTSLLLSLPLFPFWKTWKRVKDKHPDLWASKGPFDFMTLITHSEVVRSFMDIVALADRDEELVKRDPELIKWTRVSREVWKMAPRSFGMQILYFFIFLYFVAFFTHMILGIFQPSPAMPGGM